MKLNTSVPEQDAKRLTKQCQAILDRLREGPATSYELAGLALKYTSRVSDLRANGYAINSKRDGSGFVYSLIQP
jgi:hypothetical protein